MKTMIGEAAGAVWKLLKEKGEVSLAQIPRLVKRKPPVAYQAVGWLAREGKVVYRTEGKKTLVSLNSLDRRP